MIGVGQGKTVLMCAIQGKLEPLCHKLIEMGADINAKDVCSRSAVACLHASAMHSILT